MGGEVCYCGQAFEVGERAVFLRQEGVGSASCAAFGSAPENTGLLKNCGSINTQGRKKTYICKYITTCFQVVLRTDKFNNLLPMEK